MKIAAHVGLAVLLALFNAPLQGEQVAHLYQGHALVPNQSLIAQRQGVREALQQVLVKLTGNSKIAKSPALETLLLSSDDLVVAQGYTISDSLHATQQPGIGLEVNFSRTALDKLLRENALPVLPSNRPSLLIWTIKDDPITGRQFVNAIRAPDITKHIDLKLQQRGIPFVMPEYDLEDRITLTPTAAWRMDASAIAEASQRYQSDIWVLLRFYTTSSGQVRGSWLYQASGQRKLGDGRAPSVEQFINKSLDRIVDEIAPFYAYVPQKERHRLSLNVAGINSFSGYRGVLEQISRLELVENLQVTRVEGTDLALSVSIGGDIRRFYQSLLRSGYFRPATISQAFERDTLDLSWVAP